MLPWIKHAFRSGWRFHEIIRKWVSNGQSIQTGRHYLQDNFFFFNFFLHAIFKENEELRCKLTPIQTQTKPKPRTNPHPLKPNKHIKQSM